MYARPVAQQTDVWLNGRTFSVDGVLRAAKNGYLFGICGGCGKRDKAVAKIGVRSLCTECMATHVPETEAPMVGAVPSNVSETDAPTQGAGPTTESDLTVREV